MRSQDSVSKVARAISTGSRKGPRTRGTGALYMENVGKPNERAVATISRETLASYGLDATRELKFRSPAVRSFGGNVTAAKKAAEAKKDAFLDEVKAGRVKKLGRPEPTETKAIVTVEDWINRWLRVMVDPSFDAQGNRVKGLQQKTSDNYRWVVNRYILNKDFGLGQVKLAALTPSHVEDFMESMRERSIGVSSIHKSVLVLGTALEIAVKRNRETGLTTNPVRSVDNPKPPRTEKPAPDLALLDRLYAAAGDHLYAFSLDLGLRLGLRRSEMAALRFSDFDLQNNQIVLSGRTLRYRGQQPKRVKGLKMRDERQHTTEVLGADAQVWGPLLNRQRGRVLAYFLVNQKGWVGADPRTDPDALVFPSNKGLDVDPNNLTDWFRELARANGSSKTLHGLRHDFVSKHLADGIPLWQVSMMARHKTTAITEQVYGHQDEKQRQALFLQAGDWLERAQRKEAVNA